MKKLTLILSLISFNCFSQLSEQAEWIKENLPKTYRSISTYSVTDSMINAQSEWYFVCMSERYYSIDEKTYLTYVNNSCDQYGYIDFHKLAIKLEQHLKLQ